MKSMRIISFFVFVFCIQNIVAANTDAEICQKLKSGDISYSATTIQSAYSPIDETNKAIQFQLNAPAMPNYTGKVRNRILVSPTPVSRHSETCRQYKNSKSVNGEPSLGACFEDDHNSNTQTNNGVWDLERFGYVFVSQGFCVDTPDEYWTPWRSKSGGLVYRLGGFSEKGNIQTIQFSKGVTLVEFVINNEFSYQYKLSKQENANSTFKDLALESAYSTVSEALSKDVDFTASNGNEPKEIAVFKEAIGDGFSLIRVLYHIKPTDELQNYTFQVSKKISQEKPSEKDLADARREATFVIQQKKESKLQERMFESLDYYSQLLKSEPLFVKNSEAKNPSYAPLWAMFFLQTGIASDQYDMVNTMLAYHWDKQQSLQDQEFATRIVSMFSLIRIVAETSVQPIPYFSSASGIVVPIGVTRSIGLKTKNVSTYFAFAPGRQLLVKGSENKLNIYNWDILQKSPTNSMLYDLANTNEAKNVRSYLASGTKFLANQLLSTDISYQLLPRMFHTNDTSFASELSSAVSKITVESVPQGLISNELMKGSTATFIYKKGAQTLYNLPKPDSKVGKWKVKTTTVTKAGEVTENCNEINAIVSEQSTGYLLQVIASQEMPNESICNIILTDESVNEKGESIIDNEIKVETVVSGIALTDKMIQMEKCLTLETPSKCAVDAEFKFRLHPYLQSRGRVELEIVEPVVTLYKGDTKLFDAQTLYKPIPTNESLKKIFECKPKESENWYDAANGCSELSQWDGMKLYAPYNGMSTLRAKYYLKDKGNPILEEYFAASAYSVTWDVDENLFNKRLNAGVYVESKDTTITYSVKGTNWEQYLDVEVVSLKPEFLEVDLETSQSLSTKIKFVDQEKKGSTDAIVRVSRKSEFGGGIVSADTVRISNLTCSDLREIKINDDFSLKLSNISNVKPDKNGYCNYTNETIQIKFSDLFKNFPGIKYNGLSVDRSFTIPIIVFDIVNGKIINMDYTETIPQNDDFINMDFQLDVGMFTNIQLNTIKFSSSGISIDISLKFSKVIANFTDKFYPIPNLNGLENASILIDIAKKKIQFNKMENVFIKTDFAPFINLSALWIVKEPLLYKLSTSFEIVGTKFLTKSDGSLEANTINGNLTVGFKYGAPKFLPEMAFVKPNLGYQLDLITGNLKIISELGLTVRAPIANTKLVEEYEPILDKQSNDITSVSFITNVTKPCYVDFNFQFQEEKKAIIVQTELSSCMIKQGLFLLNPKLNLQLDVSSNATIMSGAGSFLYVKDYSKSDLGSKFELPVTAESWQKTERNVITGKIEPTFAFINNVTYEMSTDGENSVPKLSKASLGESSSLLKFRNWKKYLRGSISSFNYENQSTPAEIDDNLYTLSIKKFKVSLVKVSKSSTFDDAISSVTTLLTGENEISAEIGDLAVVNSELKSIQFNLLTKKISGSLSYSENETENNWSLLGDVQANLNAGFLEAGTSNKVYFLLGGGNTKGLWDAFGFGFNYAFPKPIPMGSTGLFFNSLGFNYCHNCELTIGSQNSNGNSKISHKLGYGINSLKFSLELVTLLPTFSLKGSVGFILDNKFAVKKSEDCQGKFKQLSGGLELKLNKFKPGDFINLDITGTSEFGGNTTNFCADATAIINVTGYNDQTVEVLNVTDVNATAKVAIGSSGHGSTIDLTLIGSKQHNVLGTLLKTNSNSINISFLQSTTKPRFLYQSTPNGVWDLLLKGSIYADATVKLGINRESVSKITDLNCTNTEYIAKTEMRNSSYFSLEKYLKVYARLDAKATFGIDANQILIHSDPITGSNLTLDIKVPLRLQSTFDGVAWTLGGLCASSGINLGIDVTSTIKKEPNTSLIVSKKGKIDIIAKDLVDFTYTYWFE